MLDEDVIGHDDSVPAVLDEDVVGHDGAVPMEAVCDRSTVDPNLMYYCWSGSRSIKPPSISTAPTCPTASSSSTATPPSM